MTAWTSGSPDRTPSARSSATVARTWAVPAAKGFGGTVPESSQRCVAPSRTAPVPPMPYVTRPSPRLIEEPTKTGPPSR
nr:hypothetical protein [Streptomyces bungoensis]